MKVLHVVGTRPNFMKMAPLIAALGGRADVEQCLVHTGQHYDAPLSDRFFDDLDMPEADHFLGVGSGSHAVQTASVMTALEPVLRAERPDWVVVPGDVNSTMAAAITTAKERIPLAHLESGLRSRDREMPEEHNRVIADHVADLLLTQSRDADGNLADEGIPAERIAFVGNTMIDSLRRHLPRAEELDVAASDYGASGHVLVTLHRPTLVDRDEPLLEVVDFLDRIAAERPVLFPVHPRTAARLDALGWRPSRMKLLEPQGYLRFLSLEASAAAVLTDSGGLQEETTALGVPCFTFRTTTERPITVDEGTNTLLGVGAEALASFEAALADLPGRSPVELEGWDGRAAERAADALASG